MNRGSTGRFVPPPVYIGFPLFVLAKRRSEQLFTLPWRARGMVALRADRNVGTLFCPASPRFAVRRAPRRPDPPVVCPGFGLDKYKGRGWLCRKTCSKADLYTENLVFQTMHKIQSSLRTCRIQNPNIPAAVRVGVAHGGAAGGAGRVADRSGGQEAIRPSSTPG